MGKQRAPVECRNVKDPTIVKIFFLAKDEQPKDKNYVRVYENIMDEYYKSGITRSQYIYNRRS